MLSNSLSVTLISIALIQILYECIAVVKPEFDRRAPSGYTHLQTCFESNIGQSLPIGNPRTTLSECAEACSANDGCAGFWYGWGAFGRPAPSLMWCDLKSSKTIAMIDEKHKQSCSNNHAATDSYGVYIKLQDRQK